MQIPPRIQTKVDQILELGFDEFDFTNEEDPTGQSDHIRSAIDFLRNNLKMLSKLSRQVQVGSRLLFIYLFEQFRKPPFSLFASTLVQYLWNG